MSELKGASFLIPNWPAPVNVKALSTTRFQGVSVGAYASNNLALHVGDAAELVKQNRESLRLGADLPNKPAWLNQVHSNRVVAADVVNGKVDADASYSFTVGTVCVVMTADCLPVFFTNKNGSKVAAAHAGWRGLADGILENTLEKLTEPGEQIIAWLGPAIGPKYFEVGEEVYSAFVGQDKDAAHAFVNTKCSGKWLADIYHLARLRLNKFGVVDIYGGDHCTYQNKQQFFSYRRDKVCGRMASLIWLDK